MRYVVNCAREVEDELPRNLPIAYLHLPIDDDPRQSILKHTPTLMQFLHLKQPDDAILFHCAMGLSRSAAMAVWYLRHAIFPSWSHVDVIRYVRQRRPITPNQGFMRQLIMSDYGYVAIPPVDHAYSYSLVK